MALIEVKAGKLWRGAMVVAGLAGVVSAADGFSCACAALDSTNGTANSAGINVTSRGLEADITINGRRTNRARRGGERGLTTNDAR